MGETKPVCHSYQDCSLKPVSLNYCKPLLRLEPVLGNNRSHHVEKHLLSATRESPCTAKTQGSQK